MKKGFLFLFSILLSCQVNAGFNGYTNHSRANCVGFNESISWDWTHDWWLITASQHLNIDTGDIIHTITTQPEWTWRSAAYHTLEGYGGWAVQGYHWRHYTDNTYHLERAELEIDCAIYDGWWDKNK